MLKVDTLCMETQIHQMQEIANRLEDISSRVAAVNRKLRWSTSINYAVRGSLTANCNSISRLDNAAAELSRALSSSVLQYTKAEDNARGGSDALQVTHAVPLIPGYTPFSIDSIVIERALHLVGPGAVLQYKWIKEEFDWENKVELVATTASMLIKGAVTHKDYVRIGNIMGAKNAITHWLRDVADFKDMSGHWSTAKGSLNAFLKNFTNKSSPIRNYFKETADDLLGKNGTGKSVASWIGHAATLGINVCKNVAEFKESNGTMSGVRAASETIIETVTDIGATYLIGSVLASAVAVGATAVGAPVAVPALVMTTVSGMIWSKVNNVVEDGTGKSVTEHISDGICDTVDKIGNAANKAKKSIGKWFAKLAFT